MYRKETQEVEAPKTVRQDEVQMSSWNKEKEVGVRSFAGKENTSQGDKHSPYPVIRCLSYLTDGSEIMFFMLISHILERTPSLDSSGLLMAGEG